MTERIKNRWDGAALYPSGPYSGTTTRTEPATKLVFPGEPYPAQHENWFKYQSSLDSIRRHYRAALNGFHTAAAASQPTGLSPCVDYGGFLCSDATQVCHARSELIGTWTKIAANGVDCTATWSSPGVKAYAFYSVASGVSKKYIDTAANAIATLANIDVAPRGVAQHSSTVLVIGTEAAALKCYTGSGTTWSALGNPGSTTITDPQTLVCSQKSYDYGSVIGPVAIIPRGAASGTDDYIYSTALASLVKGSKTGLTGTYVGCQYDVTRDVWVMAMQSGSDITFYECSTPAGGWTDTGISLPDTANAVDNQFLIVDGVYIICLPSGGVATSSFASAFDKPGVTVLFSFDQGATWEQSNASLGKPSGTGTLQMVAAPDRIALINEVGVCMSGALR